MTTVKKITLATVKAFMRKNADALLINVTSDFDVMTDCVESCAGGFLKGLKTDHNTEHNFGFHGAWFVLGSRDYFSAYEKDGIKGFSVSNSCGSFIVATAIKATPNTPQPENQ